jgi:hypothetical protein
LPLAFDLQFDFFDILLNYLYLLSFLVFFLPFILDKIIISLILMGLYLDLLDEVFHLFLNKLLVFKVACVFLLHFLLRILLHSNELELSFFKLRDQVLLSF